MALPLPFALPPSAATRALIAGVDLWHYTRTEFAGRMVLPDPLPPGAGFGNAMVNLSPPTGWQLDFWKLLRDLTVLDPGFAEAASYGRYMYFFLGEPSVRVRAMNVQDAPVSIRVRGADALAAAGDRMLYRGLDKVVLIRGDYRGPALVDPLPIR